MAAGHRRYLAWCSPRSPSWATTPGTGSSSRSRRANDRVGLLHANLLVGISFGWWVPKHNARHTNPNHEDLDPDISIAALAFTADQASSNTGLVRLVARHQAWLFFPFLLLEAAHLHLASLKSVLRGSGRANTVEGLLLVAHVVGYLTALILVLSPLQAVAFVVVQQGLFGLYLGCSFAPNHKGMPTLTEADALDFMRRQVLTSRNVAGSRLVDFVLGGLNYQIEHHLFPMSQAQPALPSPWSGPSARSTACPIPRPACSAPTPRPSATSTPSGHHCDPRPQPPSSAARRSAVEPTPRLL